MKVILRSGSMDAFCGIIVRVYDFCAGISKNPLDNKNFSLFNENLFSYSMFSQS